MNITLRGQAIGRDDQGFLNLTDMWRIAGEDNARRPAKWQRLHATADLIEALNVRFADIWTTPLIATKRGRTGGGTFAHIILALAYAEYLNPDLAVEVREIALRVYAGDMSVLDDYRRDKQAQLEEDGNRIAARGEIRRNNFDLNALLKSIGAKHAGQWAAFHNHGYQGLYGGMDENTIHARKQLKPNQAILDHMGFVELAYNMYRTALAQQHLKTYPVDNVRRACEVHERLGESVRTHIGSVGLEMPEELPAVESIKDAEKRLKNHQKSIG